MFQTTNQITILSHSIPIFVSWAPRTSKALGLGAETGKPCRGRISVNLTWPALWLGETQKKQSQMDMVP
jgi:hypothetical protein